MPDNSKNDWLLASTTKPEFTLGDFEQMGLTPSNTQLLDEKTYRENDKIKQMFTDTATGKFDDKQFKQHYDVAAQTYNDFAKKDYDSTILNNTYYFENNYAAPKNAPKFKETMSINKVKNPFGQVSGILGFTNKTDSDLTVREIAQTQKVQDHLSGDILDYTPNDSGFFGTIFSPSAVLAQYDEDGEHYDADLGRNVKHGKGEYKYNDAGKPYYETLGNREIYGKQSLGAFDVLTEDGSSANKWDFMDSDSKTKTLTGTIFKTAAYVVPMFLPGVGQWYTGLTLGHQLMTELLPIMAKSTAGLFLNDDLKNTSLYEAANTLQGFGAKFKTGVSDEAKLSTFNKENLFAMAGDVFGQLAQQRLIAKIPLALGQTAKETEAFAAASQKYGMDELGKMKEALKGITGKDALSQRANLLRNKWGADAGIVDVLNKWDKWSSIGSKSLGIAYMSGISATGVVEEAKAHGLDERDTAALYLGTTAGFGLFMTKFEFAQWAMEGMGLDELGGFMKKTLANRVKDIKPVINKIADAEGKIIAQGATNVGAVLESEAIAAGSSAGGEVAKRSARERMMSFFNKGKEIGKSLGESLGDISTVKRKMLAEGMEEVSEEMMQDALKLTYNGMRALGLTSTDKDKSEAFSFDDIGSRYLMSALGGAMGGGIAGVQDKISGHVHENLPETLKAEIASAVRHGYADTLQTLVDKQYKDGKLGSKALSIKQYLPENKLTDDVNYQPMTEDSGDMSHNDFVHKMISSEIKLAKDAIFQEGIQSDIRLNDVYNERAETFVDYKLHTGIVSDIDKLTQDIIDVKAKILKVTGGTKDATKSEEITEKGELNTLNSRLEELREEMMNIITGKKAYDYTQEALYSVSKNFHVPFGVDTKDTMSMRDYRKPYDSLEPEEKNDLNNKYDDYVKLEKRHQLRQTMKEFNTLNNEVTSSIPFMAEYARQNEAFVTPQSMKSSLAMLKMEKEDDVNSLDNGRLDTLNIGSIVTEDVNRPDLEILRDYVVESPYINKAIDTYLKNRYTAPYTVGGKSMSNMFNEAYGTVISDTPIDFGGINIDSIKAYTSVDLKAMFNTLNPYNYTETVAQLNDVVNNPGFAEMAKDAYQYEGDAVPDGEIVKHYLRAVKDTLEAAFTQSVTENGELLLDEAKQQAVILIDEIKQQMVNKAKNPVYELIATLTKRDGREGLGNLIDLMDNTFEDLVKKGVATDFIIEDKVTQDQLEYGQNLITKLAAVVDASTVWEGPIKGKQIGYNAALNALAAQSEDIEHEELATLEAYDAAHIKQTLELIQAKLNFLLNLHKFNQDGSIREMKMTGATMATLYLESLSPESDSFKALESQGVDMSEIRTAFDSATQYADNLTALKTDGTNKIALKSGDDNFKSIRAERDKIEQAYFKAVNSLPNKVDVLNKIFDSFDKTKYTLEGFETIDFSSNTRRIGHAQELVYLAQTLTIDPKQFYKDFTGNLTEGEDFLKDDPYAPFFGQEHVLKQMYWHMISKMSPVDTFKKITEIMIVPDTTLTDKQKVDLKSKMALPALRNVSVLYGIPGAGKTSSALYYLTKIAERYGLDTAIFAPHEKQGENLKENLESVGTIYNSQKLVSDLIKTVLGEELYTAIETDYAGEKGYVNAVTYSVGDALTNIDPKSTIAYRKGEVNAGINFNPNHPLISKFLSNKTKTIEFEGKVPSVIVIDEATHIKGVELQLLDKAIEYHNANSNKPITLLLVGDREQRGNSVKFKEGYNDIISPDNVGNMYSVITPVLSQSLRNRNNVKNKNINLVRALRKTVETATYNKNYGMIQKVLDEGITFDFTVDDEKGLVGEHFVKDIVQKDLETLFKNPTDTVALITDKPNGSASLVKMIASIPGAEQRLTIISPDHVQGLEYDNIIIDVEPGAKSNNFTDILNTFNSIEMLYTMISRSKKGSLIKAPFINGIKLNDNTQDVKVQTIELDKDVVGAYKDFTLEAIKSSFANLEDLGLSPTETRVTPKPSTTSGMSDLNQDEEFAKAGYSVVLKQASNEVEPTDLPVNIAGESIPVDQGETRPLTYTFHERLGVSVDKKNTIKDTQTNPIISGKDLAGFFELINDTELEEGMSINDPRITLARDQMKRLKTGLMAYSQKVQDGENAGKLANFLSANYAVHDKILSKLDFDKAALMLETKEYDHTVDASFELNSTNTPQGGGLISYLTMEIPLIKPVEGASPIVVFTISAFPNANNPNVASRKGVMATLGNIRDNHTRTAVNGRSYFYLKPDLTIEEVLKPTSNLYLRPSAEKSYKEFKQEHAHLNHSEPYIIMNSKIINQDDEVAQQLFANFNRGGVGPNNEVNTESSSLIGKAVVFVSLDKTIPKNELADRYRRQLNSQVERKLKGEAIDPDPGNIRMVVLNKKGVPFKDWLAKNVSISRSMTENNIDLKAQRRAYSNNFAAATMIGALVNFKRRAEYYKENGKPEEFRANLRLKPDLYGPKRLEKLISDVDSLLKNVLPILTGKTFNDIYATGGNNINAYLEANKSKIDDFVNKLFKDSPDAKTKAVEHFIASDLLTNINKFEKDNSLKTFKDVDGKALSLNIPNSALYNFVSAIRLTVAGGTFTNTAGVDQFVDGLFPSAFKSKEADSIEYDKFVTGLEDIISYKFPDGIHINPVIRTATADNRYVSDAPFVVPTGNIDDDFKVDVSIQTPTIYFNPDSIDFRPTDIVEEDKGVKVEQYKEVEQKVIDAIDERIPDTDVLSKISTAALATVTETHSLEADNLNDINNALKGGNAETHAASAVAETMAIVAEKVAELSDDVMTVNGIEVIVMPNTEHGVELLPLNSAASQHANGQLQEIGVPETNVTVEQTVTNKPGSTEKVREFSVTNADNGEIIATFAYENKQFTPVNYLGSLPTDLDIVGKAIAGTWLQEHYDAFTNMMNQPEYVKTYNVDMKLKAGKSYYLVGSYLKANGFETELSELSKAYDNLIKETKCN